MKMSTTTAARRAASTPGPIPPSQALSTPAAYSKVTPWTKRSGGSGKSRSPPGPVVSAAATATLTTASPQRSETGSRRGRVGTSAIHALPARDGLTPRRAAIRTSSATDPARIFAIT